MSRVAACVYSKVLGARILLWHNRAIKSSSRHKTLYRRRLSRDYPTYTTGKGNELPVGRISHQFTLHSHQDNLNMNQQQQQRIHPKHPGGPVPGVVQNILEVGPRCRGRGCEYIQARKTRDHHE